MGKYTRNITHGLQDQDSLRAAPMRVRSVSSLCKFLKELGLPKSTVRRAVTNLDAAEDPEWGELETTFNLKSVFSENVETLVKDYMTAEQSMHRGLMK